MLICPHCGKEFDERKKPKGKWYFTNRWVIIALLSIGPFALPMIWYNPGYKSLTKWLLTIITLIATVILIVIFVILIGILIEQFKNITQMLSV
jgi:uncharacterized protein (DUF983 family)